MCIMTGCSIGFMPNRVGRERTSENNYARKMAPDATRGSKGGNVIARRLDALAC